MIVKQPNRVLKNRGGITMREYIASAYDGHDYIFSFSAPIIGPGARRTTRMP